MEEIRSLFQAFSEIKDFDGWMIGKLYFYKNKEIKSSEEIVHTIKDDMQEDNKKIVSAKIIKQRKDYAILNAVGNGNGIQMHILKPKTAFKIGSEIQQKEKNCVELTSRAFSKEEIQKFTRDVHDNNWIHQVEKPVVPGFMMVEWLWSQKEVSLWNKVMIFRAPVYAQEKIIVYQQSSLPYYFAITERQEQEPITEINKKEKRKYLLWYVKSQCQKKK